MYNNPYEEYMRNSLGYNQIPITNMNQMNMNYMNNMMTEMYETEGNFMCGQTSVEDIYPEIYRIVYPMICKACMVVNENVTEDLVSRITDEVYVNLENIEIINETRGSDGNIYTKSNKVVKTDQLNTRINSNSNNNSINLKQVIRQGNPLLRDLIRILVLRELIGNPERLPRPRPPFRPPFGGFSPVISNNLNY